MRGHRTFVRRAIAPGLFGASLLLLAVALTGCLDIESFQAPTFVVLGQDLTYTVTMSVLTETPPPNSSNLRRPNDQSQPSSGWTMGIRLPNDWQVVQVIATDTPTQPVFHEDPTIERFFQQNTGGGKIFKSKSGYRWWVGKVDVNNLPQNVKINGTVVVTLRAARRIGLSSLDFQAGGYNFEGQLYLNDAGRQLDVPVNVIRTPTPPTATPKAKATPTVRR